ncbi:MAG: sigma-70 family RNA polymerase sigma factor [Rikenellaceae bacterium]|jgi:RNA polymerase sigma-70 factor (ECF subfamily)|nr:sigma-70 family RNA polymerase sigma factor [Rikenellaceae bacterium]
MPHDDKYYVGRTRAGAVEAFGELVDRYGGRVYSLVARIVGNREEAEELAQDVFVKAFVHLGSFREQCSFSTWLYRIAWNTAISATRRRRLRGLPLDEKLADEGQDEWFDEGPDDDRRLERLDAALSTLPPDERALVLLFYTEERSVEEIAAITGLSRPNVKTKLHRIRKKLLILTGDER